MIFSFPFSEDSHFYQQARGDLLEISLFPSVIHPQSMNSSHLSRVFTNIYPISATRPRDKSERDRSQLQHSQMLVAQQRSPQKVLSQSPPQSSSYREKERDRELSPKVFAADLRHQISLSQSPSLSPRRHPQQPYIIISRPQPSPEDRS
jgi:hypothetical protein